MRITRSRRRLGGVTGLVTVAIALVVGGAGGGSESGCGSGRECGRAGRVVPEAPVVVATSLC